MRRALLAAILATTVWVVPGRAQNQPVHLEVALGDVSLNKVPFLIAADAGFYARNGLDVHQYITPSAAAVVARNGIVVPPEYVGGPKEPPIVVGGGAPLIAHAAQAGGPHRVIIATTENMVRDHILTRGDIRSEQDLRGKKLGAGIGNVPGYAAILYVERLGLSGQVTITRDADIESLKAGKADAIMANLFATAKAPEEGLYDLVDLSKYAMPEPGSGLSVDPAWLKDNRDTATRFVKAMVEATAMMKKDKKILAQTLAKWYNLTDPKMADRLFAMAQDFPDKPYPEVKGINMAFKMYSSDMLRKTKPEDYYDSSIVTDLDKSGFLDKARK